ncbi:Mannose-6-phosphate isomerase, cupin superfamily [Sphingomonas gellani]|uniref:Mannose-6-phosphate isomerase, cupin superfamily n=1 Tax=Sphingomonas gellani TaxID=1166340 RepID=A0A1H8GHY7_9SPHN|nr:cupin domain-containing protein [Sphingomonas gellani]SEN43410.1 Mannose-6-phosphate isomerase, cupin superfamily [Sphingomonas gellani]
MAIFNKDMVKLASGNDFFQKEVYLDKQIQIVLMSLKPGEEIGMESHRADQSTFFVEGEGQAIVDGHSTKVSGNHLIVIPKGAEHNIVNKGTTPLKLFSVYAPPAEPAGVAHKTKEEAEEAEEGFISRAAKKAKEIVGG